MLEEIMQMIKQHGQDAVVNNADVPNEHNDAVMNEAGSSVMSMLQNMVQNGQANEVNNLLDPNHPAAQQMQSNFADNIMQKFGLSSGAASNVASSLIPNVLQSVIGKFQGGNFDISQITQALSGGGGIGNIAAKFGLDKDGDGDVDLNDAKKMFGF